VTGVGASSVKGVDSTGHKVKVQTECHKARWFIQMPAIQVMGDILLSTGVKLSVVSRIRKSLSRALYGGSLGQLAWF